jgi:uncharacterized membrane protein
MAHLDAKGDTIPRIEPRATRGGRRVGTRYAGQPASSFASLRTVMATPLPPAGAAPSPSLVNTAHLVYALHTLGLVIGAFGTATVIGTFLFGWPSIIAVIINYVKRSDVRGTWLDSHFSWQIRTFWWALLWAVIIGIVGAVLAIVVIGFAIWIVGFFVLGVWAIYRIARGWLRLKDGRPMPA